MKPRSRLRTFIISVVICLAVLGGVVVWRLNTFRLSATESDWMTWILDGKVKPGRKFFPPKGTCVAGLLDPDTQVPDDAVVLRDEHHTIIVYSREFEIHSIHVFQSDQKPKERWLFRDEEKMKRHEELVMQQAK